MQAKTYAKSDGNHVLMNSTGLEDISWLMEIDKDYSFSSSSAAVLIFCVFLMLNILILIFTVLNIDKLYTWIKEQRESWKDLYKASAGVLTFINLAAFGGDLYCVIMIARAAIYDTFSAFLAVKLLLVVIIIILELVFSCLSTLKHRSMYGIMHALALCQIVWFGHRVATDAIIFVIAFIIAPAQTLGTATLLLSTVACMILFVSSLLHNHCQCSNKVVVGTVLIGICTIVIIVIVTILFIALVDNGLQSAGIGGFILSIVPPMTIFVIGLCVNRDIIRRKFNIFANEEVSNAAVNAPTNETITESQRQVNETTPLIQNN